MKYLKSLWHKLGDDRLTLIASGAALIMFFQDLAQAHYWFALFDLFILYVGYTAWKNIGRTQQFKEFS